MLKKTILAYVVFCFLSTSFVFAHCEIPCGIYDDHARIHEIHEHITTIEKSMMKITELSKEEKVNYNQVVRWIQNKEQHAQKIQDTVNTYFMTQRIIPREPDASEMYKKYIQELTLLHKMLIAAMKSQQTVDLSYAKELHNLLDAFSRSYFEK
jgi:nickel superoxide dismutase